MSAAPFALQSLNGARATFLCNACHRPFVHTFRTAPTNLTALRARLMFSTENIRCHNHDCPTQKTHKAKRSARPR